MRTPEEYTEKHIAGSTNYNINGSDFQKQLETLDKSKPLYVYCLAGSRSAKASDMAVKAGFKEVYNLEGGITAWMGANKAVATANGEAPKQGLSMDDYLQRIKSDKLVLVDFNAVWCGPCKILKPTVIKVTKDNADKVSLFDIDVDKNPLVANSMTVSSIPLLLLYKNGKEVWRNLGVVDEKTLTYIIKQQAN